MITAIIIPNVVTSNIPLPLPSKPPPPLVPFGVSVVASSAFQPGVIGAFVGIFVGVFVVGGVVGDVVGDVLGFIV